MKKDHPCGGNSFTVLRIGSDVRIKCNLCQHDMTLQRIKLEKNIKKVLCPDGSERKGKTGTVTEEESNE